MNLCVNMDVFKSKDHFGDFDPLDFFFIWFVCLFVSSGDTCIRYVDSGVRCCC